MIDKVREALAELRMKGETNHAHLDNFAQMVQSAVLGNPYLPGEPKVPPLSPCVGVAHREPAHYDNCHCCAPRWGWVGSKVVVR
jgi:hypothetical protein